MTHSHTNLEKIQVARERIDAAQIQRLKHLPHALETPVGDGDESESLDVEFPIKSLDPLEDGITTSSEIVDDHGLEAWFGVALDQFPHAVTFWLSPDEGHGKRQASRNPRRPRHSS